jgi:hypothetical protein
VGFSAEKCRNSGCAAKHSQSELRLDRQDAESVLAYEGMLIANSCSSFVLLYTHSLPLSSLPTTPHSLIAIMLSIKNSLCSVLLLASYAAAASQSAPGQSVINLEVESCSKENTGASNAQGTFMPPLLW